MSVNLRSEELTMLKNATAIHKKPMIVPTLLLFLFLSISFNSPTRLTRLLSDLFRYSSEENSSPASSSLTSISSAWLSFRSIDASGILLPVSHFEMVLSVTSICSANCFCDNPCFFLLYAINFPILIWSMIFAS